MNKVMGTEMSLAEIEYLLFCAIDRVESFNTEKELAKNAAAEIVEYLRAPMLDHHKNRMVHVSWDSLVMFAPWVAKEIKNFPERIHCLSEAKDSNPCSRFLLLPEGGESS